MRDKAQRALSNAQLAAATRQRFATRAARAPAGAAPPDLASTYVLDVGSKPRAAIEQAIATLAADPDVVYVEEDKRVGVVFVPNDPRYSELYGLANMGAAQAWDTARGTGIVVAVIDTGLDFKHPDIDANVWTNPGEVADNGIDDDGNGLIDDFRGWDFVGPSWTSPTPDNDPTDVHGHGTHVAGTIAAEATTAIGRGRRRVRRADYGAARPRRRRQRRRRPARQRDRVRGRRGRRRHQRQLGRRRHVADDQGRDRLCPLAGRAVRRGGRQRQH